MARLAAPFVVYTFPRSGSAWLMDTLNSHPEVAACGELFREEGGMPDYGRDDIPYFRSYLEGRPGGGRAARLRRVAYLRLVYRGRPGVRAAGFKLMYAQVGRNPGLFQYFALRRVRAVHLVRANLLDAVISYEVGKKTGIFHPRRGDVVPKAAVSLDPLALRARLEDMEWAIARGRSRLERYRLPRLDVAYEELVGRRDETLERVLRFLGVEPDVGTLDSELVRIGIGRALELVENADEVRAVLAGTRFEWMLDGNRP